jgi:hypothetical protein
MRITPTKQVNEIESLVEDFRWKESIAKYSLGAGIPRLLKFGVKIVSTEWTKSYLLGNRKKTSSIHG